MIVSRLSIEAPRRAADASLCPTVRAYEEGDEHALVRLLGGPFAHDAGLEHWRWKLRHWPSAAASVFVATSGDDAVFHYGGIALPFVSNSVTLPAMISVDAMTAPGFRRRGLLTGGVARAFAEWRARGVAFTLGLPNERWGSRIAAAGWQRLFPLQWLVRPLRPEVFAARRLGWPWLGRTTLVGRAWSAWLRGRPRRDPRIELCEVRRAGEVFDGLWARCRPDAALSPVRDGAWVQWRFLSSPARNYEVALAYREREAVGYRAMHIARSKDRTSAFLAEVVARDDDDAARDSLLAGAIASADEAGADVLAALAVARTPLHAALRGAGFLPGPAFDVHIVQFARSLSMDRLRRPDSWRLSGAEFDVV